jgi:hypothetical protein
MPQRSVYIREEDDDKWLALKSKAEFIHNALNPEEGFWAKGLPKENKPIKTPRVPGDPKQVITPNMIIHTPKDAEKALAHAIRGDEAAADMMGVKLCKIHGTPLTKFGKCLIKGCKYA